MHWFESQVAIAAAPGLLRTVSDVLFQEAESWLGATFPPPHISQYWYHPWTPWTRPALSM
jgi:hypothetical protein